MKRDLVDEKCLVPKKEGGIRDGSGGGGLKTWLGMKDPRIVRASRALGGKDRHSKVNTIKGLRDRRVRLSVQTAIQLYDLQDRLGLSQPSKVVDWLISVTQDEIDKLPPLPMPVSGVFPAIDEQSISTQQPSQQQQQHQVVLPVATKWKQSEDDVVHEQFIQDHELHRPGLGLLQTINPSLFSISTGGNTSAGVSQVVRSYSSANSILQPYSYHHHHGTGFLQPLMPAGSQLFQPYMGNYIDFSESVPPTPTTTNTTSLQTSAVSSSSSSPFALFYSSATPSMLPFPNEHLLKALSLPKLPHSQ